MSKRQKFVLFVLLATTVSALFFAFVLSPMGAFMALQARSSEDAGTWVDDPRNWFRAFGEEIPKEVQVVHSYYWNSDHFTDEYIYFFEIRSTPDWRDTFLKKRGVAPVLPSQARSFRKNHGFPIPPAWFAPDPVTDYQVWDWRGYFGSIWINKTNDHIHFWGSKL